MDQNAVTTEVARKRPPSAELELVINGLSLLFFDYYSIKTLALNPIKSKPITTDNDYLTIFDLDPADLDRQRFYECVDAIPIPPVQLPSAGIASGTARLLFRVLDDSFLLAVTVVNVDDARAGGLLKARPPLLKPEQPLRTRDVLEVIQHLNEVSAAGYRSVCESRKRVLDEIFGVGNLTPFGETRSRKNVGIQIWSIAQPLQNLDGMSITSRFAWELAGLLEYGSDIFLTDSDAWRNRRPDQVAALVATGTDILADHRVLTHRSVCVEISQVDRPKLSIRSANRLAAYGFDSTSLYLWCIAAAQESVLLSFNDQLSDELRRIEAVFRTNRQEKAAAEALERIVSTKIAFYRALDSVFWLTSRMREERHATFFTETEEAWGLRHMRREVQQKIDVLTEIAGEILQLIAMTTPETDHGC